MARYLIVEDGKVIAHQPVEATSLKSAMSGLEEGLFTVYTLQGQEKTVQIKAVTETRMSFLEDDESE